MCKFIRSWNMLFRLAIMLLTPCREQTGSNSGMGLNKDQQRVINHISIKDNKYLRNTYVFTIFSPNRRLDKFVCVHVYVYVWM